MEQPQIAAPLTMQDGDIGFCQIQVRVFASFYHPSLCLAVNPPFPERQIDLAFKIPVSIKL
jgi:hypothetical protein